MNHGGKYDLTKMYWYHNFQWPKVWLTFAISLFKWRVGFHLDLSMSGLYDRENCDHRNVRITIDLLFVSIDIQYFVQAWGLTSEGQPRLILKCLANEVRP